MLVAVFIIIETGNFRSTKSHPEMFIHCRILEYAVERDSREGFKKQIEKLKRDYSLGSLNEADAKIFMSGLFRLIIESRSFRCAVALVKGEIGLSVDLNMTFDTNVGPLHVAASELTPDITQLLLENGANPNLLCAHGSLPLDYALAAVRAWALWNHEDSVYRLLLILSGKRMLDPLMTVQLLLNHLSDAEFYDEIIHCGLEGRTVELAALLLAAPRKSFSIEKVYLPSDGYKHTMSIREYAVHQLVSLTNEECQLGGVSPSKLSECKHKKKVMMSTMLLFEVFRRKDCHFEGFVATSPCKLFTVEEVVEMLMALGFELTGKDVVVADRMIGPGKVQHILNKNLQSRKSVDETADVVSNSAQPENEKLLPLHKELQKLSSNEMLCNWTPEESILKLIVMLCLPEMRALLEDIELPMQDVETINELACYCATENKLIELAVLLVAAHGKLLDKITVETEDNENMNINFRQFINLEFSKLLDVKYRLMGKKVEEDKILYRSCERRISSIISSLPLLEIFEKAGSAIGGYLKSRKHDVPSEVVAGDVVRLFKASGFELEDVQINQPNRISVGEDTINDTLRMIEMNPRSQRPSYFPGTFGVHNPSSSTHNQLRQFSSASHLPGPSVLSTSFGSLRPLKRFDVKLGSCHENALLPEQKEVRATLKQQRIHVFEGGRPQLVPIALGLRRIIRYI